MQEVLEPGGNKLGSLEGKDLCRLSREEFHAYVSPYATEILLGHLNFLRGQCKFSCEYISGLDNMKYKKSEEYIGLEFLLV